MGKTIIQTIGPLYGEPVNGTVFGRPNGSIYVPSANTIKAELINERQYLVYTLYSPKNATYAVCNSAGALSYDVTKQVHAVAESQDLQNYIVAQISEDSDFSTIAGERRFNAGAFNVYALAVASGDLVPIVADKKYYLRTVLMASSGEPVATSDTIELIGVVVA